MQAYRQNDVATHFAVFLHYCYLRNVSRLVSAVRIVAGAISFLLAYVTTLRLVLTLNNTHAPQSVVICASAMAVATACGIGLAGLIFPQPIRRAGLLLCLATAAAYPAALAVMSAPGTTVQSMQSLYIVVTLLAGLIAASVFERSLVRVPAFQVPSLAMPVPRFAATAAVGLACLALGSTALLGVPDVLSPAPARPPAVSG